MSTITLRLPARLLERAKRRAVKEQRILQEFATAALERHVKTPLAREEDHS
jgi:predicted DNA binding CopG/RHH family protein